MSYMYLCRFSQIITRSVGIYVVLLVDLRGFALFFKDLRSHPCRSVWIHVDLFNDTLESMLIYQIGGFIYADQLWSMLIVTLICNKQKRIFVNHDSGIHGSTWILGDSFLDSCGFTRIVIQVFCGFLNIFFRSTYVIQWATRIWVDHRRTITWSVGIYTVLLVDLWGFALFYKDLCSHP